MGWSLGIQLLASRVLFTRSYSMPMICLNTPSSGWKDTWLTNGEAPPTYPAGTHLNLVLLTLVVPNPSSPMETPYRWLAVHQLSPSILGCLPWRNMAATPPLGYLWAMPPTMLLLSQSIRQPVNSTPKVPVPLRLLWARQVTVTSRRPPVWPWALRYRKTVRKRSPSLPLLISMLLPVPRLIA